MLCDVVPYTEKGEPGNCFIMAPDRVQAWIAEHAAELLEQGYVRIAVTDHVPTRIVGDRRGKR